MAACVDAMRSETTAMEGGGQVKEEPYLHAESVNRLCQRNRIILA